MKALRKEPTRRYASAEQFAADIGRFLAGMPVTARRDTFLYRARKFVRRNAPTVAAAALALAFLITALVLQTRHKAEIQRQHNTLLVANHRLEETRTILVNMLSGAQTSGKGPSATLGEVLLDAARQLETSPPRDPLTLASIREAIGAAMMTLGMPDKARPLLESALVQFKAQAADAEATLSTEVELAQLLYYEGKFAEAEPLLRQLLKDERARLSPSIHSAREGDLLNALGAVLRLQNKLDEAMTIQQEALTARTAASPDGAGGRGLPAAESLNNIATIHFSAGRYPEAVTAYRKALDIRAGKLRPGHPMLLATDMNLGTALLRTGDTTESIPLLRQAVDGWEPAFGPDHPGIVAARTALAQALRQAGHSDESIVVLNAALAWQTKRLDPASPLILATKANLALSTAAASSCAAAITALEPLRTDPAYPKLSAGLARQVTTALAAAYEKCGRAGDAARLRAETAKP